MASKSSVFDWHSKCEAHDKKKMSVCRCVPKPVEFLSNLNQLRLEVGENRCVLVNRNLKHNNGLSLNMEEFLMVFGNVAIYDFIAKVRVSTEAEEIRTIIPLHSNNGLTVHDLVVSCKKGHDRDGIFMCKRIGLVNTDRPRKSDDGHFKMYREATSNLFIPTLEFEVLLDQAVILFLAMNPNINNHVFQGIVPIVNFFCGVVEAAIEGQNESLVNQVLRLLWSGSPSRRYVSNSTQFLTSIVDFIRNASETGYNKMADEIPLQKIKNTFHMICEKDLDPVKVILYLKFFKFGIAIQDFEGVYVAGTPLNAKSPHYPSNKTKAWSKARKPMSVLTYNGDHRVFFGGLLPLPLCHLFANKDLTMAEPAALTESGRMSPDTVVAAANMEDEDFDEVPGPSGKSTEKLTIDPTQNKPEVVEAGAATNKLDGGNVESNTNKVVVAVDTDISDDQLIVDLGQSESGTSEAEMESRPKKMKISKQGRKNRRGRGRTGRRSVSGKQTETKVTTSRQGNDDVAVSAKPEVNKPTRKSPRNTKEVNYTEPEANTSRAIDNLDDDDEDDMEVDKTTSAATNSPEKSEDQNKSKHAPEERCGSCCANVTSSTRTVSAMSTTLSETANWVEMSPDDGFGAQRWVTPTPPPPSPNKSSIEVLNETVNNVVQTSRQEANVRQRLINAAENNDDGHEDFFEDSGPECHSTPKSDDDGIPPGQGDEMADPSPQDQPGQEQSAQDQDGQDRGAQEQPGTDQVGTDQSGPEHSRQDQNAQQQPGPDQVGTDQSGPEQPPQDQPSPDQSATDQTGHHQEESDRRYIDNEEPVNLIRANPMQVQAGRHGQEYQNGVGGYPARTVRSPPPGFGAVAAWTYGQQYQSHRPLMHPRIVYATGQPQQFPSPHLHHQQQYGGVIGDHQQHYGHYNNAQQQQYHHHQQQQHHHHQQQQHHHHQQQQQQHHQQQQQQQHHQQQQQQQHHQQQQQQQQQQHHHHHHHQHQQHPQPHQYGHYGQQQQQPHHMYHQQQQQQQQHQHLMQRQGRARVVIQYANDANEVGVVGPRQPEMACFVFTPLNSPVTNQLIEQVSRMHHRP